MADGHENIRPRRGMPNVKLDRDEFCRRYLQQFIDPAFDHVRDQLDGVADIAFEAYANSRKAPLTQKAGPAFHDPSYDLAIDWIDAHKAVQEAQRRHEDLAARPRVLLVNASPRSEHTCPGEMSKSWRLIEIAREAIAERQAIDVDILDLSRTASEYGRHIYPCKACFSTAAALCHWPCSCYPNHSLGQTQDWMNEIYPLWVAAHGVMIITPVHWYQATSPLKLMIDRLVCADGGNPDPTLTQGKDAARAKQIELEGWRYPRHLDGRIFSIVVHGDVEGAENVRRALSDWMAFMHMRPAGNKAELDRYIGYWKPYATSHEALDQDEAIQGEVANAAKTLADAVVAARTHGVPKAGEDLPDPRQK